MEVFFSWNEYYQRMVRGLNGIIVAAMARASVWESPMQLISK